MEEKDKLAQELTDEQTEQAAGGAGARPRGEKVACKRCGYEIDIFFATDLGCCPKCGYGK